MLMNVKLVCTIVAKFKSATTQSVLLSVYVQLVSKVMVSHVKISTNASSESTNVPPTQHAKIQLAPINVFVTRVSVVLPVLILTSVLSDTTSVTKMPFAIIMRDHTLVPVASILSVMEFINAFQVKTVQKMTQLVIITNVRSAIPISSSTRATTNESVSIMMVHLSIQCFLLVMIQPDSTSLVN